MTTIPALTAAQYTRLGQATQYSIGDIIANSQTGSAVTPLVFSLSSRLVGGGYLNAMRCIIAAASGTIVLPDFKLYVFNKAADIPFAAGSYPADNAALNISAAAFRQVVGIFTFGVGSWLNQAGGVTAAGAHIYQRAQLDSGYAAITDEALSSAGLVGVMQAMNTWNPGNVVNTFDFTGDFLPHR